MKSEAYRGTLGLYTVQFQLTSGGEEESSMLNFKPLPEGSGEDRGIWCLYNSYSMCVALGSTPEHMQQLNQYCSMVRGLQFAFILFKCAAK